MPILHNPYWMYYFFAAVVAYPIVRILKRAGLPSVYACLLALPIFGFACCIGVTAILPWPVQKKEG